VRDWSDLWIAVAAGRWLANARPGELLEVVSDDRAFDAVGDTAATLGVIFRRTSYRSVPATAERTTEPTRRRRRRSGRGRGAGRAPAHPGEAPLPLAAASHPTPTVRPLMGDEAAHAASQEQIRTALARLTGGDSTRWISLDTLANRLKAEGFIRPPGSPRLVVRLRRIKNVEVTPSGMVRLLAEGTEPSSTPALPPPQRAHPTRRGGRGRRRRTESSDSSAPEVTDGGTES